VQSLTSRKSSGIIGQGTNHTAYLPLPGNAWKCTAKASLWDVKQEDDGNWDVGRDLSKLHWRQIYDARVT
jgi:hypothetical protein